MNFVGTTVVKDIHLMIELVTKTKMNIYIRMIQYVYGILYIDPV